MAELNDKTQYKFTDDSEDDDDVSLSDPTIARIVFDVLFHDPPFYVGEFNDGDSA